ncbi:MAG: RluA family pseudouridine synthase [Oscillospiraceae bacterium]|nr:RluA family pseudouridine synthase [Oscillospiraceae bacterium]
MTEITVTRNDAGQRADRFLTKVYPNLTLPLICKLMRKKRIKLNGAKTEPNTKLSEGDVFRFYLSDELLSKGGAKESDFRSVPSDISIVYEDENILLTDKPVGMVVHEDNDNTSDTLINRIKCYLWKKGEYDPDKEQSFAPALCNRIDRNTGGIVIAAKNAESLRILNQKIRDRELVKLYLCVVQGKPEKNSALLTAYLHKLSEENRVVVSDRKTPENRTIKTKYCVLDSIGSQSLVEVDLLTGRTHQIRAHFAHIGHPLMGDGKYGSNKVNKQYGYAQQALYSYKLTFDFTTDAGCLSYLDKKSFEVADRNAIWFVKRYNEIKNS